MYMMPVLFHTMAYETSVPHCAASSSIGLQSLGNTVGPGLKTAFEAYRGRSDVRESSYHIEVVVS